MRIHSSRRHQEPSWLWQYGLRSGALSGRKGVMVSATGHVQEVAEGVFAYPQEDGGWWVNTTGFLAAADHVVAVDACATRRRTRALLEAIDQTVGKPVRTLVNTHFHGDRTYG